MVRVSLEVPKCHSLPGIDYKEKNMVFIENSELIVAMALHRWNAKEIQQGSPQLES